MKPTGAWLMDRFTCKGTAGGKWAAVLLNTSSSSQSLVSRVQFIYAGILSGPRCGIQEWAPNSYMCHFDTRILFKTSLKREIGQLSRTFQSKPLSRKFILSFFTHAADLSSRRTGRVSYVSLSWLHMHSREDRANDRRRHVNRGWLCIPLDSLRSRYSRLSVLQGKFSASEKEAETQRGRETQEPQGKL